MPVCTLLTDFGTSDWYVGAMKGTLLRLAPGTVLVDLTHEIAPGDVAAASFVLAGAAPTFPPGTVHVAVVDPGVGSARRMLAVDAAGAIFVAPDNGLLAPLFAGARVRSIERPDLFLVAPGQTFHGRDRFAPVAAAILRGVRLETLGPAIDDPARLEEVSPARSGDGGSRITGRVVHVDRYGNLITDVPAAWLGGRAARARIGALDIRHAATHYAELERGVLGLIVGSLGTLEIALRDESAAAATGLRRGDPVTIDLI